jgi:hypothetical protein
LNGDVAIQCSLDLKCCSKESLIKSRRLIYTGLAGHRLMPDLNLAGVAGLEPATPGFGVR